MTTTKYRVTLSVDGNHTVSVQSDDPAAVTEALVWAKKTYGQLGRLPQAALPGELLSDDLATAIRDSDEPPVCAVHALPMVRVSGKRDDFWSCHEKNDDGSWCSYRPLQGT